MNREETAHAQRSHTRFDALYREDADAAQSVAYAVNTVLRFSTPWSHEPFGRDPVDTIAAACAARSPGHRQHIDQQRGID